MTTPSWSLMSVMGCIGACLAAVEIHVVSSNVGTMLTAYEPGLSGRLGDSVLSVYRVSVATGEGPACDVGGECWVVGVVSCDVGTELAMSVEKEGSVSTNGIDGTPG